MLVKPPRKGQPVSKVAKYIGDAKLNRKLNKAKLGRIKKDLKKEILLLQIKLQKSISELKRVRIKSAEDRKRIAELEKELAISQKRYNELDDSSMTPIMPGKL